MRLKEEPTKFNTQREAYWYQRGLIDAKDSVIMELEQAIKRYNLEWLDHLPTGEE